jgi:hypothetical protein
MDPVSRVDVLSERSLLPSHAARMPIKSNVLTMSNVRFLKKGCTFVCFIGFPQESKTKSKTILINAA